MHTRRCFVLVATLAAPALRARAQEGPVERTPRLPRLANGMWRVYAHAPAYNAELTWDDGALLWQNRTVRVGVQGILTLDVDVTKLWVTGRVEGMRRVEDLASPFNPGADPTKHNPDISTGLVLRNAAGVRLRIVDATILEPWNDHERPNATRLGVDFGGVKLGVKL